MEGRDELDTSSAINSDSSEAIFSDVPEAEIDHAVVEAFLAERPVVAYRVIRVDADRLREFIRSDATDKSLTFYTFQKDPIALVARGDEEFSDGWQTGFANWFGSVEGEEESTTSFFINYTGEVDASIISPRQGFVNIDPIKGTGTHVMWLRDPKFKQVID